MRTAGLTGYVPLDRAPAQRWLHYYARAVLRFLALFTLLVALVVPPAALAQDAEPVRLGLLSQRTRHPLYLLHLQPGPRRARVLEPGVFEVAVQTDWSNVWEKWSRVVAEGGQRQDIDMEVVRTALGLRVGLPFGIEVGMEVPLITLVGGIADGTIQAWHRLIKVENGGRDRVRDDRFNYEVFMPNAVDYKVDRPVVMGLGDITTELSVQVLRPHGPVPGVTARVMLKLPTGKYERGLGSGDPDVAAVVHVEHGWRRFAVYGSAGVIVLGREGPMTPILWPASFTFTGGLELGLTADWSLIAQVHGNTAFHKGFVHRFTNMSPAGLTIGTKVRLGPMDLGIGMEQDILGGDPTADITMVFDIAFRLGEGHAQRTAVGVGP